jgi:hypothetical protein
VRDIFQRGAQRRAIKRAEQHPIKKVATASYVIIAYNMPNIAIRLSSIKLRAAHPNSPARHDACEKESQASRRAALSRWESFA